MEQFEQLLTCAICLDRYRNPKLLPCQHSFCCEPCMEGLVDYVRRQVKCPECRAEHRIPYQGVQAFPTNVTLQRFLELHIDLTGELPDPMSNQFMERCQVCSEKSYLNLCAHCDKKICTDCKEAHMEVLKKEISRITQQVKRVLHRLEDALISIDKTTVNMQTNSVNMIEEIDDIYRRLTKSLKDRTEYLKQEVERYLTTEIKQLSTFRSNLEQEVANIQSNCDLVEKYVLQERVNPLPWQDNELMDTKDIFVKTMEFIRGFEYEPNDHSRRIRFTMNQDPNVLSSTLANIGDLHLPPIQQPTIGHNLGSSASFANSNQLKPDQGSALMRSKSDHRLTTQFRGQDDDDSLNFGHTKRFRAYGQEEDGAGERKSRFRSRFTRHLDSSMDDGDGGPGGRVRFENAAKERERVIDTDDICRGPLSGIGRLGDSSRVLQRITEIEKPPKPVQPASLNTTGPATGKSSWSSGNTPASATSGVAPWRRQQSEEEAEISAKSKKPSNTNNTTNTGNTSKIEDVTNKSSVTSSPTKAVSRTTSYGDSEQDNNSNSNASSNTANLSSHETSSNRRVKKLSPERFPKKRSESEDSSESATSSGSSSVGTGAAFSTDELKARFLNKTTPSATIAAPTDPSVATNAPSRTRASSASSNSSSTAALGTTSTTPNRSRYQNRYTTSNKTPDKTNEVSKEEDDEEEESSSSSESSETESEEESDSSSPAARTLTTTNTNTREPNQSYRSRMEKTDIGPLLARSANVRDRERERQKAPSPTGISSYQRKRGDDSTSNYTGGSNALSSYRRNRISSPPPRDTERYSTTNSSSRYPSSYTSSTQDYGSGSGTGLSRSRTGTSLYSNTGDDSSSRYSSGGLASKYLNRSRHNFDYDDLSSSSTPTSNRYGSSVSSNASSGPMTRRSYLTKHKDGAEVWDGAHSAGSLSGSKSSRLSNLRDRRAKVARSKSSHDVLAGLDFNRDDDNDDDEPTSPISPHALYNRRKSTATGMDEYKTSSNDESANLSSWARYLKNKYGKDKQQGTGNAVLSLPKSPTEDISRLNFPTTQTQYCLKKKPILVFGSRGSDSGFFTWPRGVSIGPDNSIVVADSSNHRVQVFDSKGSFLKEFGQYGTEPGEFDCLAGVAVNRIGQFIISDRYNHRIQVFDPSGRWLRSFGSQGSIGDSKFNYPWGVTTDALGFIYVCDKENHRVAVFQSDGSYVGTMGARGELNSPHYIAVTSTNKVIVSDTNNNKIRIFDVNGKLLSSFGSEGTDNGCFKLPRGVAVDEQGYIFVGDSGNNRVQIFSPEGRWIHSFGSWGNGEGEFKGIEALAVMSNGNIVVCDRENHRIQIF